VRKLLVAPCLLLALTACNQRTSAPAKTASSSSAPAVDAASAGNVSGVVRYAGAVPAHVKIDMGLDPACNMAEANYSEQVVANDGKLANVYIYVKSGLAPHSYPKPSDPAVITQKGCRYLPHVLAARTGQTLRVLNDDPAMHNIHPAPKASGNHEWNVSQMPKGEPIERTFDSPEVMMPVKCNQHPWMKMYLNVNDSPFFSVSSTDGAFTIAGLPAGDYVLAAVHEKFGEKDIPIHVNEKQTAHAEFTF